MLFLFEAVNIVAILLMVFMLVVILRQQPSKAQTAFVLYDIFTIIFIVGIYLEQIHSDTIGEALSGLCVQYVGQAGFLMALLWFASVFARCAIPKWVYGLEAVINTAVLVGVFTAEFHPYFYTHMEILTDGMYNRIEVDGGVLWCLHYLHFGAVILTILILCAARYKKSSSVQKKRILYVSVGIGVLVAELILKGAGVFGSYNPVVIAMAVSMFCLMMAIVRYGYFGSLHAAVDNAFNHGNEGLIILDDDDKVAFVNRRMEELFPDICEGDPISGQKEITEIMEEDHLLNRDGVTYELRMEDIIEHGEKNGCMLWLIDQTQTIRTMQQLREADEAKTQFLMKVSHELRTPMNTMLGMNEMILRESSERSIQDYAKEIKDAGEQMLSLIDEVLETSRLKSGKATISEAPYCIGEVLQRAEEMIRPQADKKGLTFSVETDTELTKEDLFLCGDRVHLLQILTNLLSNAVKYTDRGRILLKAKTGFIAEKKALVLQISDTGIGIRKEEKEQIFENFGRGSNTGGKDGMGLGLAIVKQLVEEMGGSISVDSNLGKGSTFCLLLPYHEATPEELTAWKEKEKTDRSYASGTGKDSSPDFHTKTILAVDDNERNLMVLTYLLRRTKAQIETVTDGQAAVEACARKRYDLILLDHMMPEMDGIETLHRIREDGGGLNRDTDVIALTANAASGAEQMYLMEGFADYLAKPIDPGKLEQMLIHYFTTGNRENASEVNEDAVPDDISRLRQLEQYGILMDKGMYYADNDVTFYMELLDLFAGQQEERQKKLEAVRDSIVRQIDRRETEQKTLWNTWVVSFHGLKGEARGIGASDLGEYFYQMELAGREKDLKKIQEIYPVVLEEWKRVTEGIKTVMQGGKGTGEG